MTFDKREIKWESDLWEKVDYKDALLCSSRETWAAIFDFGLLEISGGDSDLTRR